MNHVSHLSTFRHSHIYGAPQVLHWAHFYGVGSSAWNKVICKTHISSVNFCAHVFWGVFKALFKVKNKLKWSNWLCYTFFGPPSPLTLHCIHSSTNWIEPVGWKQKGSEFGKRKKKSQIKRFTHVVGATCKHTPVQTDASLRTCFSEEA